jgi:hypothetical protein
MRGGSVTVNICAKSTIPIREHHGVYTVYIVYVESCEYFRICEKENWIFFSTRDH